MAIRKGTIPPYDQISLSAAADAQNTLYILTALGPAQDSVAQPSHVGVDIVRDSGAYERYLLPGHATMIGVSPSGDRIYALDSRSAIIQVFRRPGSP